METQTIDRQELTEWPENPELEATTEAVNGDKRVSNGCQTASRELNAYEPVTKPVPGINTVDYILVDTTEHIRDGRRTVRTFIKAICNQKYLIVEDQDTDATVESVEQRAIEAMTEVLRKAMENEGIFVAR